MTHQHLLPELMEERDSTPSPSAVASRSFRRAIERGFASQALRDLLFITAVQGRLPRTARDHVLQMLRRYGINPSESFRATRLLAALQGVPLEGEEAIWPLENRSPVRRGDVSSAGTVHEMHAILDRFDPDDLISADGRQLELTVRRLGTDRIPGQIDVARGHHLTGGDP